MQNTGRLRQLLLPQGRLGGRKLLPWANCKQGGGGEAHSAPARAAGRTPHAVRPVRVRLCACPLRGWETLALIKHGCGKRVKDGGAGKNGGERCTLGKAGYAPRLPAQVGFQEGRVTAKPWKGSLSSCGCAVQRRHSLDLGLRDALPLELGARSVSGLLALGCSGPLALLIT